MLAIHSQLRVTVGGAALASDLVATVQKCRSCCVAHIIVAFFQLQDSKFQQFVLLPQVLRLGLQLRYPLGQHRGATCEHRVQYDTSDCFEMD